MTDAFKQILAWKLSLAGIPATGTGTVLAPDGQTPLQRVSGHRDAFATICPGMHLAAKLPEIRAGAAAVIAGQGIPTTPTAPAATPGSGQAMVSWTAPTSVGGSAITGNTVTASPGGQTARTAGATTATVTGLTGGTTYRFTVLATNLVGSGPGSVLSNAVTPTTDAALARLSDFNGDGFADLVARNASGTLSLYPGSGTGGFLPRRQMGIGWNGMNALVTPGDVTGDGKSDLLARDTKGVLWLYRGNGTGGIAPGIVIGTGWKGMNALVTPGNWDRTGGNDVLGRDSTGRLWLYPGTGTSSLTARRLIGSGWQSLTYIG